MTRLDQELVRRRLSASRSRARLAILEGQVVVNGSTARRPAQQVDPDTAIIVAEAAQRFVGRGAHKLAAAIDAFGIDIIGRSAIDVGAATGGFTDYLLQRGAPSVVAVDVGHGQLHEKLAADPRVDIHEGINIRYADPIGLGAPFDLVVVDLSFISLRLVATVLASLGGAGSDWIVLVKPQFEVGAAELGKGGVVRSAEARANAVVTAAGALGDAGLVVQAAIPSPIAGGSGNVEALLWLRRSGREMPQSDLYKVLLDE